MPQTSRSPGAARAVKAFITADPQASPSVANSDLVDVGALEYARVRSATGEILAVYRMRPSGRMRRLVQWPQGIALLPAKAVA